MKYTGFANFDSTQARKKFFEEYTHIAKKAKWISKYTTAASFEDLDEDELYFVKKFADWEDSRTNYPQG